MAKTVIILGGGVGGLTAAARLRELVADEDQVVLVDQSFDGVLGLSLLWILRGWRTVKTVRVRPTQASLPGVRMITSEVHRIDLSRCTVNTNQGPLAYDALVLALGASLDLPKTAGLQGALEAGVAGHFYATKRAVALHDRLCELEAGRLIVLVAGVPFKCPAAPFEGALLIADLLRERSVRDAVSIEVFTPDPLPMPVAGTAVGQALVSMMTEAGIGFHPNKTIAHIDVEATTLAFADGSREPFDLVAVIPPHQVPAPVERTGLGPSGWVPVDARTLRTSVDGVWAIGDTTLLTLPNGKPLPKAAVFAEGEAEAVACGIAQHLGYDAPDPYFSGYGACYVEIGDHKAAKGEGNFLDPPAPSVTLHEPSAHFHEEKVEQESEWLRRWNS